MEKDNLKRAILKELRNPKFYAENGINYTERNLDDAFNVF